MLKTDSCQRDEKKPFFTLDLFKYVCVHLYTIIKCKGICCVIPYSVICITVVVFPPTASHYYFMMVCCVTVIVVCLELRILLLCGSDLLESFCIPGLWNESDVR